jgi:putative redox protein
MTDAMATKKRIVLHHLIDHRFLAMNEQGDRAMVDGDSPSTGLRPMELLLAALAGCTGYDVVDIMRKKRLPLERYRVEAEGEQAGHPPRRYTRIVVTHVGAGPGVTREALLKAAQLSHEKYCSVAATLNAPIEVRAVVEGGSPDAEPAPEPREAGPDAT